MVDAYASARQHSTTLAHCRILAFLCPGVVAAVDTRWPLLSANALPLCCLSSCSFCVCICPCRDSPDFTKTSQDGYTFDTFWEGRMIAKDIINSHTETKHPHARRNRHHDHMDAEEVMSSFHAT